MDTKYLIAIAAVFCLWLAYDKGYESAETEFNLKIESMKLDHANEIIKAQEKEKERYDQKTKELVARYNDEHVRYVERMHQLEQKLQSRGDMETIARERDRCFSLAVRGERLLRRADGLIEGLM